MKNFSIIILLLGLLLAGLLMKKQSQTKVNVPNIISSTPVEIEKVPEITKKQLEDQVKQQQIKLDREIAP